ncbi:DUF5050 domain-containing protein [Kamptonema cortianum]|nr:DUF5050 domain-containing protein [Geitlerinema splendidum]MDK3160907.1 DUF5050 domain-containing protein [Kamptonema cortianum]
MLTFLASALLLPLPIQTASLPSYQVSSSENVNVDISPDNKSIVFTCYKDFSIDNGEIWLMDIETKKARKIGDGDDATFSADGKKIAYAHWPDGEEGSEIYTMDLDGKNAKRLTNSEDECWDPTWSPDGKKIVYVTSGDEFETTQLMQVSASGGEPKQIVKLSTSFTPVYHPTEHQVYFCSYTEITKEIFSMAVFSWKEGSLEAIFRKPTSEQFDFYSCAISRDGKFIGYEVADLESESSEIVISEFSGKNEKKFGQFPTVQSLCIGKGGEFVIASIPSAEDGLSATLYLLQGEKRTALTNGK